MKSIEKKNKKSLKDLEQELNETNDIKEKEVTIKKIINEICDEKEMEKGVKKLINQNPKILEYLAKL